MSRVLRTEVLVIGGGATGVGVLHDLSLRGFEAVLVEQRDLSAGTTGRYHGLLHSGGRYAVTDPEAASACTEENRVLRQILPHRIVDTGGFFVGLPEDPPDYGPRFLAACRSAGVPCEPVEPATVLREEPALTDDIVAAFRVPDAASDGVGATRDLAAAARGRGARLLSQNRVVDLPRSGDRVIGARCVDRRSGTEVRIEADLVINATGPWAGRVAAMAGVEVTIRGSKGSMIAYTGRPVGTVINRLRPPDDGDILVPLGPSVVMGTTSIDVDDSGAREVTAPEAELLAAAAARLVPGLADAKIDDRWAGVRPLYEPREDAADSNDGAPDEHRTPGPDGQHANRSQERDDSPADSAGDGRSVGRDFALLDHERRDGVSGFLTITGGKWTTFRRMAEATVDAACAQLGTERPCRTRQVLVEPSEPQ